MTFMLNAKTLVATTALLCSAAFASAQAQAQDSGFRDCLQNIKADAVRQGELFFSNGCLIRCHDDLM